MPSRMDRYNDLNIKKRTEKNKDLYRTMYDDTKYNNVEEISIIEKDEQIDIEKIRELINGTKNINKPKIAKENPPQPLTEEIEEQKNYDIRDVLTKAKTKRVDKDSRYSNTKYNIMESEDIDEELKDNEEKLKDIMDSISNPIDNTLDLLDDLKSICDPELKEKINENIEENDNIDKSFYTSSIEFNNDDFDEYEEQPKKNHKVTQNIIIFILLIMIVAVILYGISRIKG